MMYFRQLADDLDPLPLLSTLQAHPELWGQITARQDDPGSAHHATQCIFLRGPAQATRWHVQHDLAALDYPALALLKEPAAALVNPLLQRIGIEELGRVLITRLPPGCAIDEHRDEGEYAEHYSRFHFPLQSDPGNLFYCGSEAVEMLPGSAWWFEHQALHCVVNRSSRDRIHLIVDAIIPGMRRAASSR